LKTVLDQFDLDLIGLSDRAALRQWLVDQGKKKAAASDLMTQIHLALAATGARPTTDLPPTLHRFDPDAIRARLTQFKKTTKER
jgi:hypothetical protein